MEKNAVIKYYCCEDKIIVRIVEEGDKGNSDT